MTLSNPPLDNRSGPVRPVTGPGTLIDVTPDSAGWTNLAFAVVDVAPSAPHQGVADGRETAIVTLAGAGRVLVDGLTVDVARDLGVRRGRPHRVRPAGRRVHDRDRRIRHGGDRVGPRRGQAAGQGVRAVGDAQRDPRRRQRPTARWCTPSPTRFRPSA